MIDTLWRRICILEWAPGEPINEQALCHEFGLSRSTVRGVLLQMAAEGALQLEANRAPRVPLITHDTVRHFFEAAPLVYMAAVRLASTCATRQDIKSLRDIEAQLRKSARHKGEQQCSMLSNVFYLHIGQMAANHYLIPGLNRLLIDHARLLKLREHGQPSDAVQRDVTTDCQQYNIIIEALERHDAEAAATGMRIHLQILRKRMLPGGTSWFMQNPVNLCPIRSESRPSP